MLPVFLKLGNFYSPGGKIPMSSNRHYTTAGYILDSNNSQGNTFYLMYYI